MIYFYDLNSLPDVYAQKQNSIENTTGVYDYMGSAWLKVWNFLDNSLLTIPMIIMNQNTFKRILEEI